MSTGGGGGGSSAAMTLASAVVNVMADTKALHQQLNLVQSHLAGLQNSMNRGTDPSTAQQNLAGLGGGFSGMVEGILMSFRGGIQSILGMLTGGALMAAFAGIVSSSVGMAGQFEQSVQSFEALTGSAEEAKAILEEVNQFAAATPFRTPEIEAAVKASMLYGFSTKEAMKQVKMLGDISAISGAEVSELTRMYAQMKSMGPYASVGSDFLGMLMNRGVLSRKDIAKELGISEVALADRISKGMLKWKQIEPMFLKLTQEGGRFYRGIERQAGTLPGLMSTLVDNLDLVRRTIGEIFLEGAKYYTQIGIQIAGTILKWSQALVEFNENSGGMVARLASALAISFTLVAVVPRLITSIRMLATVMNISMASTGWGALIVAVGGLVYLILSVASSMRKVGESSGVLTRIGKAASDLYAQLSTAFSGVFEKLTEAFNPIAEMIEGALVSAVNFVSQNMDTIIGIIQAGVLIVSTWIKTWSTVVVAEFRVAIAVFMALANAIGRVFGSDTGDMLSKSLEFFLNYVETNAALIIWLSNKFMWLVDAFEYVVTASIDMSYNILSTISEMAAGVMRLTKTMVSGVRETFGGIFSPFTDAISGAYQVAVKFISNIGGVFGDLLSGNFLGAIKGIYSAFADLFSGILGVWGDLFSGILGVFTGTFSGIGKALGGTFIPFTDAISGAYEVAAQFVSNIGSIFGDLLSGNFLGAIKGIHSAFADLFSGILGVWGDLFSGILGVFTDTFSGISNALGGMFLPFIDAISGAYEVAAQFVSNIGSIFGDLLSGNLTGALKGIYSAFGKMFSGILGIASKWAAGMKAAIKGALTGDMGNAAVKMAEDIRLEVSYTMNRMGDAATNESDSTYNARMRLTEGERDERSLTDILKDIQFDRKYGAASGSGASGVIQFASEMIGDKDEQDPPGSGGGMLMKAGFVGATSAINEMQQILLDEMKGDQQLGVLKDIRDVQRQTLEMQKKGMAMGVDEKPAVIGE